VQRSRRRRLTGQTTAAAPTAPTPHAPATVVQQNSSTVASAQWRRPYATPIGRQLAIVASHNGHVPDQ